MKRCVANKIGTSEHVPVPDYHLRGTQDRDSEANLLRLSLPDRRGQFLLKSCSLGQIGENGWMMRGTATHTVRSKHFCRPHGLPRHHSSTQSGCLHDLGRDIHSLRGDLWGWDPNNEDCGEYTGGAAFNVFL